MSEFVTVSVRQGALRGRRRRTPAGSPFLSFQGVPYAKPPLGALRFKAPELPEPYEGVRDATQDGNMCMQGDPFTKTVAGDEDCLVLNIFTPHLPTERNEETPLAVLVWIHGGGFVSGSCFLYQPEPFMDYGVVLVSVNYRVGPLGFLSLGTLEAPGNAGLKDQTMALRWVKDNIAAFGGDPDNVTIFGQSAGGASVHYQLLSPLAEGLFHRAIAQSGSAYSPWAICRDPVGRATRLAQAAGCDPSALEDLDALLSWLRRLPAEALVEAAEAVKTPEEVRRGLVFSFVPCVEPPHEGAFLTEEPAALAARGHVHRVPLILGLTTHEGILMLPRTLVRLNLVPSASYGDDAANEEAMMQAAEERLIAETARDLERLLPEELTAGRPNSARIRHMCHRIKEFFFHGMEITEDTLEGLVHILSDMHFGLGVIRMAHEHARLGVPVYLYEFGYYGRSNFVSIMVESQVQGVSHGDELAYQFNISLVPAPEEGSPEKLVRHRLALMWTDFAKSGNPTPALTDVIKTNWLPFSESSPNYLIISEEIKLDVDLLKERMQFWEELRNI